MSYPTIDVHAMKAEAGGNWLQLISRIAGVELPLLDGKNHPCPKCGGKDRFRMIDTDAGALFCNQCFKERNGDGIAAIMWLTGMTFGETVHRVAEELGMTAGTSDRDIVAEMGWRKQTSANALRDFGAHADLRGELQVCRVPMYDADMQKTGDFDMAPTAELEKGKATKGSRLGLFVAKQPAFGDTVVLVEGVKDASALHCLGQQAVGLPTCRMDAAFARMFRGCEVIIVPDRDKAGADGANETAGRLYGVAASVKIAELPAEYKEVGGADVRDVLRTRDGETKVKDAISNARSWSPLRREEIKVVSLADAIAAYLTGIDNAQPLLKTGLPDVDYAIGGGLLPGEMMIVAGRPSHGKTVVGMQALECLSKVVPVLMISEEMSIVALAQRSICGLTDIGTDQWKMHKEDLIVAAVEHFSGRQPYLVVESCGTADKAVSAIEQAKEKFGIGAVAVDYVQMLKGKGDGRYEQVSDVSTRLKQAAVRNSVVLIAICQLNRGVESAARKSTCPRMSDLRDSGQLEQDADVILFVEWLHRTNPSAHLKSEYRILIAKNRNRPILKSVIDCVFMPERQRICGKAAEWQDASDQPNYEPAFDAAGW